MTNSDLHNATKFFESNDLGLSTNLHGLIKDMAFLYYLGVQLKSIHKFAAEQGYQAGYSSFCRWLKRNVDFDQLCQEHLKEFRTKDPRDGRSTRHSRSQNAQGGAAGEFAGRTSFATSSRNKSQAMTEPSAHISSRPTDRAREVMEKWRMRTYEEQLEKLGLEKPR